MFVMAINKSSGTIFKKHINGNVLTFMVNMEAYTAINYTSFMTGPPVYDGALYSAIVIT